MSNIEQFWGEMGKLDVSLFKSDLNSVCIFLMIEKALSDSESALLFGNTNKVFASFERTPNLFVPEKMSSSFPIS
jgi:hypothetical protein